MKKAHTGTERTRQDGFSGERHVILPASVVTKAGKLPVVRDLLPSRIGHFPSAEGHFVRRSEPIDEWILIYCVSGRGWCSLENRRWRIGRDMLIVVPAGMAHATPTARPGNPRGRSTGYT